MHPVSSRPERLPTVADSVPAGIESAAGVAGVEDSMERSRPVDDLPYIDEHSRRIDAPPDAIWAALAKVLGRIHGGSLLARVLACDPARATDSFTGRPGDAVPGFRVVEAEPDRLALRGRHRFARYALTFVLDGDHLRARTHAAFPGVLGRLYRAAVIGTGAHRVVTRHLLRQIARAA
jgi:hypothetical protein